MSGHIGDSLSKKISNEENVKKLLDIVTDLKPIVYESGRRFQSKGGNADDNVKMKMIWEQAKIAQSKDTSATYNDIRDLHTAIHELNEAGEDLIEDEDSLALDVWHGIKRLFESVFSIGFNRQELDAEVYAHFLVSEREKFPKDSLTEFLKKAEARYEKIWDKPLPQSHWKAIFSHFPILKGISRGELDHEPKAVLFACGLLEKMELTTEKNFRDLLREVAEEYREEYNFLPHPYVKAIINSIPVRDFWLSSDIHKSDQGYQLGFAMLFMGYEKDYSVPYPLQDIVDSYKSLITTQGEVQGAIDFPKLLGEQELKRLKLVMSPHVKKVDASKLHPKQLHILYTYYMNRSQNRSSISDNPEFESLVAQKIHEILVKSLNKRGVL